MEKKVIGIDVGGTNLRGALVGADGKITKRMKVASGAEQGIETVIGVGQYIIDETDHTAELEVVVRDEYQGQGIGRELIAHLTHIARRNGLHGFTAEVLMDNRSMLHLFESAGFIVEKRLEGGMYELKMSFRDG
ncbi:MAG: GNAT family N-acetyltransferase [Candidatus Dadabacteria bacterium]|nr:MAG: GNAT family N-acetyltransferase [Candidatus Dadabacteria bacterium]